MTSAGDIAFLYGTLKVMLENGWQDSAFVREHSVGFEDLRRTVEAINQLPNRFLFVSRPFIFLDPAPQERGIEFETI